VRELLVLREVEGLSYRELADVIQLPMGTVTRERNLPAPAGDDHRER
jgi:DNA-directed RNA polymerase specialized sigma24 family protein